MNALPQLHSTIDHLYVGEVERRWAENEPTAINKQESRDALEVNADGFARDHQVEAVHGGPDMALHYYPADHFAFWHDMHPDFAPALKAGGFGENISAHTLTEENTCIGDIFKFGTLKLQVTQGRKPCWKIAAHTGIKSMAFDMTKTLRTGWYFRVLEAGHLQHGDKIELIERIEPDWNIKRVTGFMLDKKTPAKDCAEAALVKGLSDDWQQKFTQRGRQG